MDLFKIELKIKITELESEIIRLNAQIYDLKDRLDLSLHSEAFYTRAMDEQHEELLEQYAKILRLEAQAERR